MTFISWRLALLNKNKPETGEYTDEVPLGYDRQGWEETKAWQQDRERQRRQYQILPERSEKPETKNKIGEVLYCHATKKTRTVDPGHWFFHTGQWSQCAEASRVADGRWQVRICFAPYAKKLPEDAVNFGSIDEVKHFVSEYFEVPLVKVKSSDFPNPKNL